MIIRKGSGKWHPSDSWTTTVVGPSTRPNVIQHLTPVNGGSAAETLVRFPLRSTVRASPFVMSRSLRSQCDDQSMNRPASASDRMCASQSACAHVEGNPAGMVQSGIRSIPNNFYGVRSGHVVTILGSRGSKLTRLLGRHIDLRGSTCHFQQLPTASRRKH